MPDEVELYPWNASAVQLRQEQQLTEASLYQVLDEWGIRGRARRNLRELVMAMAAGIGDFERERAGKGKPTEADTEDEEE